MKTLQFTVINMMENFKNKRKMFTVYDITRILHVNDPTIDHNEVRKLVEYYYQGMGLNRSVGYQLPFNPPPQIYFTDDQDINKYDPNSLIPVTCQVFIKPSENQKKTQTVNIPTEEKMTLYALVNKKTGKRIPPFKGNSIGLYKTRNGPSQLNRYDKKDHEIVKYEVTLKRVN